MSRVKMSTLKIIRPSQRYNRLADADFLSRIDAVHKGLFGNPAYPAPPVDEPGFKAARDAYAAAIAAALDGSKKAIADRQKKREDLTIMLRLIDHYVEAASKGDMTTFLSSGLEAASSTRTPPQPLPQPSIIKVDQGNTGQLLVSIKPVPKARNYEIRYAALGTGAAPGATTTWAQISVASTKQAAPINGLSPGTTYTIQARAFGKLGYTDWSASFTRMCI